MSVQSLKTRNTITLKGSAQVVSEFFNHAVNSILYQRAVYPQETFVNKTYHKLSVMGTKDPGLQQYLSTVAKQMQVWLEQGMLQRLVLVITSTITQQTLERWTFEVETNKEVVAGKGPLPEKAEKDIQAEISAIIRQITASITFLPLLEDPCTFDLLVYTDSKSKVPEEWEESDPRYVIAGTDVKLRSFTTKVHKVDTMVTYKTEADEAT